MAGKKTGKRLLTWVLVLVMALSLLPLNALAANGPETDSSSGMNFDKRLVDDKPDSDGNYTIQMTAQATGTTTTKVEPMDIVLVLDQSGSMADDFNGKTTYKDEARRQYAMKAAVNSFIGEVAAKYSDDADHRMAIVTFDDNAKTLAGWTAVNSDGADALTSEISDLPKEPEGATNVGAGMQMAKNLMNDAYTGNNTDRQKTVIVFTDGVPTTASDFSTTVANAAIAAAKDMKDNGVTIYTVGIFNDAKPEQLYGDSGFNKNSNGTVGSNWSDFSVWSIGDIRNYDVPAGNRFLNYLSSNFERATNIGLKVYSATFWGIGYHGWEITQNFNRDSSDYYKTATDASDLANIFEKIATTVPAPVNDKLDENTVITDTLSDYFTFAGTEDDVEVYAIDANGNKKESEDAAKATATPNGKVVRVTNYDFSAHYKGIGDAEETLVIKIKVKPDTSYTNWGESGKYETNKGNATVTHPNIEEPIAKAASPEVHVETYKVTYRPGDGTSNEDTDQYYLNGTTRQVKANEFTAPDGYEFDCWKDEDGNTYQAGGTITFDKSNVTLTAQWREIEAADLSVEKTVTRINGSTPTTDANGNITTIAYPGDEIEWTITVANSGNATGNFTLKDVLKGRTDELTVSPAMAEGANSYTIAPKNPTTGEPTTMTFTVTYTVQPADVTGNGLVNTVTMNGTSVESALVPTAQKYTVTGTIDNDGTVTNPSQKLKPGEKSTAMTFAPADGYKITSVTVNGTAVSDLTLNSDGSYTYPAMDSVTENIAVNVKTDKRTDLSYTVKYVNKITGSEIQKSVVKNGKTFGDTITGESEKVSIANYTYVEANPDLLTIGTDATKNVITLYYTKDAPTPGTFDFNDVVYGDGKVTPAITKTVKGNVGKNFKETFKVTVKGADEKSTATMSAAPASYTGEAKVTYSGLKDIAFLFDTNDKLTFHNEGKYTYTVREIPGKTSRMSYDTTEYTLTINVVLDADSNTYQVESWQFTPGNREYTTALNIVNTYRTYHPSAPSKPTLNTGDHYAYVMGYPDGMVRPNGSITRAEVSTILFRLLSDKTRDEYFTTESSFTDVKAGAWYNNSIATLEKAGVIVDTAKGGAFRPNEAITRAELAAMLAQFSDAKPVKGVKFSDVSAEHWAYEAIAIAAKMGWIEGYPDGTFRPDATITRAEMMTLVNRALERVPSDEDHLLSKRVMLTFPDCKSGDWFYIAVQEATNSHTYERAATEKNGDEQWTALRANRDWTQLEK